MTVAVFFVCPFAPSFVIFIFTTYNEENNSCKVSATTVIAVVSAAAVFVLVRRFDRVSRVIECSGT